MPFLPSASYHSADFIRGEANAAAMDAIARWPDWPYSIMLLYGESGSGKTHLSHLFAARSAATFLPPERIGTLPADQLLAGNHAWILDAIDSVTEEAALAQLINHARARGDYLLLTARAPAAQLPMRLPDLRSRLNAMPAVGLGTPDDALLCGVLAKAFADRQLRISPDVLQFAISQLERSYSAIQQFAAIMDRISLSRGRPITVRLIRDALRSNAGQTPRNQL